MKYFLFILCSFSSMFAMHKHTVHSTDNGKKLATYIYTIGTIELRKITDPSMLPLYCYMQTIVQQEPELLEKTPQEFTTQRLKEVYGILYRQSLPRDIFLSETGHQQLVEETARTVEAYLASLLSIKEHEK